MCKTKATLFSCAVVTNFARSFLAFHPAANAAEVMHYKSEERGLLNKQVISDGNVYISHEHTNIICMSMCQLPCLCSVCTGQVLITAHAGY